QAVSVVVGEGLAMAVAIDGLDQVAAGVVAVAHQRQRGAGGPLRMGGEPEGGDAIAGVLERDDAGIVGVAEADETASAIMIEDEYGSPLADPTGPTDALEVGRVEREDLAAWGNELDRAGAPRDQPM